MNLWNTLRKVPKQAITSFNNQKLVTSQGSGCTVRWQRAKMVSEGREGDSREANWFLCIVLDSSCWKGLAGLYHMFWCKASEELRNATITN